MTFEEVLKKKKELQAELEGVNKTFTKLAEKAFKNWTKDIFSRYPALDSIQWIQYTPSFNDGDPCYFRCYNDYYSINSDEQEDINEDGFASEEIESLKKEVDAWMENFDDDDMERLFGNGAKVTLTKKGVTVDEYYD